MGDNFRSIRKFIPLVAGLINEDHVANNPISLAISLPVGVEGVFTPVKQGFIEFMGSDWKQPIRISLPVEHKKWEPGLMGLDRLLYYLHLNNIQINGVRIVLNSKVKGLDVFPFLIPLFLQYLFDDIKEIPQKTKIKWIAQNMPGILSDAQAIGYTIPFQDQIILYSRESDEYIIAKDVFMNFQKVLIRLPAVYEIMVGKNQKPFEDWTNLLMGNNHLNILNELKKLNIHFNNKDSEDLIFNLKNHEAQFLTIPLTEGNRSYIMVYTYPAATIHFLEFCERKCKQILKNGYIIRVEEQIQSV